LYGIYASLNLSCGAPWWADCNSIVPGREKWVIIKYFSGIFNKYFSGMLKAFSVGGPAKIWTMAQWRFVRIIRKKLDMKNTGV